MEFEEIDKYSVIFTEGLHYPKNLWEKDLYDYREVFPTKHNGKIPLTLNSIEELYEVSKILNSLEFRVSIKDCEGSFNRVWIEKNKDYKPGFFRLLVHIKNKTDYYKFRRVLMNGFKSLGYLVQYEVGYSRTGNPESSHCIYK